MKKILKNGRLVPMEKPLKNTSNTVAKPEPVVVDNTNSDSDMVSKYEEFTVAKLKELLDESKIDYPKTAKKADLVELADENLVDESEL